MYFLFSPHSFFGLCFPLPLPRGSLSHPTLWKESRVALKFGCVIPHVLVNTRTPNRPKASRIGEAGPISKLRYFFYSLIDESACGGFHIPPWTYSRVSLSCQAAVLLEGSGWVRRNPMKRAGVDWRCRSKWVVREVPLNKQDSASTCSESLVSWKAVISQGCSVRPRSLPSINILNNDSGSKIGLHSWCLEA